MGNRVRFPTPSKDHGEHAARIATILAQPHTLQRREFECPTLCGCVVQELAVWNKRGTVVLYDGPELILSQCADHAHLTTAEALYDEIYNFHGRAWRPGCGCSVHSWCDDRDGDKKVHTPNAHPDHTVCCADHAHLTDPKGHHDTLMAECVEREAARPPRVASDDDLTIEGPGTFVIASDPDSGKLSVRRVK